MLFNKTKRGKIMAIFAALIFFIFTLPVYVAVDYVTESKCIAVSASMTSFIVSLFAGVNFVFI